MSEALALEHQQEVRHQLDEQTDVDDPPTLSAVPDLEVPYADPQVELDDYIVPSQSDRKTGAVLRPSINISTGRLANGQPLSVYYERGYKPGDVDLRIARALTEATKLYEQTHRHS